MFFFCYSGTEDVEGREAPLAGSLSRPYTVSVSVVKAQQCCRERDMRNEPSDDPPGYALTGSLALSGWHLVSRSASRVSPAVTGSVVL